MSLDIAFPDIPVFHRPGAVGRAAVAALRRGTFTHLNRSVHVGRENPDWQLNDVSRQRLWTVTLHYHYWVFDLAEAAREGIPDAFDLLDDYLSDWLVRCDLDHVGPSSLAWNAYAIATRLGWWIRALRVLRCDSEDRSSPLVARIMESLSRQAEFLANHIEWDLRANHVFRNAVGLAWAGRFIGGHQAQRWLDQATRIAVAQIDEQILPDGGHFERSPMYHIQVMEDVLTLAMLVRDVKARQKLIATWHTMAEYLAWMRHPDGQIPLFNDAAQGAVCEPGRMLQLGSRIGVFPDTSARRGGRIFPNAGVVIWHGDPWTVFFDVGRVGPDYQPGHAHSDTLTLECSLGKSRLFVDPGTYGYDNDTTRQYDRSTKAHNTVSIDRKDSSEVWHIFRVGARARPMNVRADFDAGSMSAAAAHDGFHCLPGSPTHHRQVIVDKGNRLRIDDRITGERRHQMEGGYLMAPEWTAVPRPSGWELSFGDRRVRVTVRSDSRVQLALEDRPHHSEFGLERSTCRLTWKWEGALPFEVTTVVEPY